MTRRGQTSWPPRWRTASRRWSSSPASTGRRPTRWTSSRRPARTSTATPAGTLRNDGLIEIGDELDQQVILHELAHVWFNDSLFSGRWINEAFADQSAALAMAAAGEEQPQPEAIEADDPGRLKLNDWSDPDLQAEVSDDQERYGYNASWAVLDAITDEIGVDGFTRRDPSPPRRARWRYRGPGRPRGAGSQRSTGGSCSISSRRWAAPRGGGAVPAPRRERGGERRLRRADGRPRALRRAARGGRGVGGADLGPTGHGGLAVRVRRGADDGAPRTCSPPRPTSSTWSRTSTCPRTLRSKPATSRRPICPTWPPRRTTRSRPPRRCAARRMPRPTARVRSGRSVCSSRASRTT